MTIDPNIWTNTLSSTKNKIVDEDIEANSNKWLESIPKKKNNIFKKYSLATTLFVFGLIAVSFIKNETRNLEKEINYLKASISSIEFNLNQAILDNEVITSPENISKLAKEYLSDDLVYYKKYQIKNLNDDNKILKNVSKKNNVKILNNLPENVKVKVTKKIKKKKAELAKLQELYNDPRSIPEEVKTKVAKQIEEKKFELKNLYESPKEVLTIKRIGKWGAVQVVKVVLGMPVIPGR